MIALKRIKIFLIWQTLLGCLSITTAYSQYQIKSWTTDDGLPQNTVRSILQTPDGYLWMTTLDGLARFDGVQFTVFNKLNAPGFGSNRLGQLVQSPDGDLWISAETDFVMRYRNGEFMTYPLGDSQAQNNIISSLILDDRGSPTVFSRDGIFRWSGENFIRANPIAGETSKSSALWSKTGAFWYSNENTLHRFKDGRISDYQLPGDKKHKDDIFRLFEDRRGRIWCGTYAGLYVLENEQFKNYTVADGLPDDDAKPSAEDNNGNLWVISPKGAVIVQPDGVISAITTAQQLSDDSTAAVFQDREGSIWVGTFRRGINRLTKQTIQFYSVKDGLVSAVVHPIRQLASGDILLGGSGLTIFRNGVFSRFAVGGEKYEDGVTAIAETRDGRLWLGGWQKTFYIENGSRKLFSDDSIKSATVVDIYEQGDGAVWFASDHGLFRWQNNEMTRLTTADGLISDNVKVIRESADGTFWFGTYGGLSKLKDGFFTNFTTADGLSSNLIRSLYEDADGVLWIGSYDGGLTRFKDGRFIRYTSRDGLFNDGVFCILEDAAGNFWMNSNRGIYRVSKQQLNDFADRKINRIESIAYGKADGLVETEGNGGQQPAGIKTRDGKLWFPTQNGVAVIDPEKINPNPFPPPVLIESIALNGADASAPDGVLEISPDIENIQINYTGLSFIKPEQVRFRYRMNGLDSDWVEADTRRAAYYSHLPPGNYNFTVIAANADGVWNETGASLNVRVVPPFYRTFWFITLAIVGLFGIVVVFYQRRVERIERARRTQENFARQLIESQERERSRIAGELHDGLSQSLVIIKNRAVLSLAMPEDAERAFEQMEEISAAASEAMFEAKEMIHDLRPIQLDRFGLTKALKAMLKRVGEAHDIELRANIEEIDGILSKEAENNLFRIAQELINNVVRHSRASVANVSITRSNDFICLEIADDGIGFSSEKTNYDEYYTGGFGLLGVVERTKLLNGYAEIQSSPGNGATIKIALPIK